MDGVVYDLGEQIVLDKNKKHTISVVVDRLIVKPEIEKRLADSIETALKLADGLVSVQVVDGEEILYSTKYSCPECGISIEEIEPRLFSFNNPYGACPECAGIGYRNEIDEKLVIKDPNKTLREGAMTVTGCPSRKPIPPTIALSSRKFLSPCASTKKSKICSI